MRSDCYFAIFMLRLFILLFCVTWSFYVNQSDFKPTVWFILASNSQQSFCFASWVLTRITDLHYHAWFIFSLLHALPSPPPCSFSNTFLPYKCIFSSISVRFLLASFYKDWLTSCVCLHVWFVCTYVPDLCLMPKEIREGILSLELELWTVVSHHVGAGNWV
jgi:hypothetical protein